jgi:hypothetical protein
MRGSSPRGPARQPERLPSESTTIDRAARQQRFGRHIVKPASQPLKAVWFFGEPTDDELRGKKQPATDTQPARIRFPVRLVTANGPTFGVDTKQKS